jgi:XTP/dITP diphosphohydrolase
MSEPLRLVLATANPHKTTEIRSILAGFGVPVDLVPRPEDVPDVVEDAPDLVGNARLKAAALVEATGLPALSDDTGLEVDALDGRPGVRSARYAGEDGDAEANVAKLLGELAAVPADRRTARFRTVVMVRWPDGREVAAEGVVEGVIAPSPRGDGGFGYDPVFLADEGGGRTFAEMDSAAKDAISHRGRALRALAARLAVSDVAP